MAASILNVFRHIVLLHLKVLEHQQKQVCAGTRGGQIKFLEFSSIKSPDKTSEENMAGIINLREFWTLYYGEKGFNFFHCF